MVRRYSYGNKALMGRTDQQAMWPDETRAELEAKMKGDCKPC